MKIFNFTCILIKYFAKLKLFKKLALSSFSGKMLLFLTEKKIAFHCLLLGLSYINSPEIIDEIS